MKEMCRNQAREARELMLINFRTGIFSLFGTLICARAFQTELWPPALQSSWSGSDPAAVFSRARSPALQDPNRFTRKFGKIAAL